MTNWVTIHIANDEIEANLKKGILEAEGINCVIESIICRPKAVVTWLNEFKLNVPESQADQAKEILKHVSD